MKNNLVVIGAQWGDEGKGKIVDFFSNKYNHIVRFHGGHNAGHTLWVDGKKTVLHLIPSGVLHPKNSCYIGSGVVVSMDALIKELDGLKKSGVDVSGRLYIAENCPLIFDFHTIADKANEERKGKSKIGTTGRGIGPTYEDNVARRGLRVQDLFEKNLKAKLTNIVNHYKASFPESKDMQSISVESEMRKIKKQAAIIKQYVCDVPSILFELKSKHVPILFEGAQGAMLDVSFGTYPFVTSSHCIASQASTGSGVGLSEGYDVIGVAKAYCTRVGSGPFPTEQDNEIGQLIRDLGSEYGATTGRPRRCGWFDIPALKRAIQINGITTLAITKMDILDKFKDIEVCTHYVDKNNKKIDILPMSLEKIADLKPVYKKFKGWKKNTQGVKKYEDLPVLAKKYFDFLEKALGVNIGIISTGPERVDTIIKDVL